MAYSPSLPRSERMGLFGIGESKREKVKKIRLKQKKEGLQFAREERERKKKIRDLEARTREEQAEAAYYRAKGKKRKAKVASWSYTFPSITIGKKKQGRKLSRKRRVSLL